MNRYTVSFLLLTLLSILTKPNLLFGQEIPILSYSVNTNGQAQIEVKSSPDHYYVLKVRYDQNGTYELATALKLGEIGTTQITEPLASYPVEHYQVLEYAKTAAADTDGDGIDDLTEWENFPMQSPLNAASPISGEDGVLAIDDLATFNQLSTLKEYIQWSEFLNGKRFAKFIIVDFDTAPKIYFINGGKHDLHAGFADHIGVDHVGDHVQKGQIIYHPTTLSNNGTLGTFAFNYSNGHGRDFEVVQKTLELLAANMPFLSNNLSYIVTGLSEDEYERDQTLYDNSRIPILLEEDVYAEIDYWGLHQAEGYGLFRELSQEDIPGTKDIVLYKSLPNALPRVGGIITSIIQTPLSHVNLRAIQDGVPNAFIRDPLSIDSIANLLDRYIYFKVEQDKYYIREASLAEVNKWFEAIRPSEGQIPPLDLSYTSILPLDDITFDMFDGFGAKCANIATMRTFGFPEGTIPNGFGVPFYFYQEFMKYNGFFEQVEAMIDNEEFLFDRNLRNEILKDFRDEIKDADMPPWMLDELAAMHASFPAGTSVRCRSSTNNEDLPGFNGAGLYTSKTQHPHEGHISKSIKQVFASLWNLRAFDEREFYRVDHFKASMGVLCHPNYSDEKANGVGVSIDPIYQTKNTFYYLNSQVGEDLITNPGNTSVPEEILLDKVVTSEEDHIVIRRSNLIPEDETIMSGVYLDQMRDYLTVIHDEFAKLYEAVDNETFAMEIEYKITSEDQLIIKQARPWVTFTQPSDSVITESPNLDFKIYPNPTTDYIIVDWEDAPLTKVVISSILGQVILEKPLEPSEVTKTQIDIRALPTGVYILSGFEPGKSSYLSLKFVKR